MAAARTNSAWRMVGLLGVLAMCGAIALCLARWPDIQFELGYAYANGNFHGWVQGFGPDRRKAIEWLGKAARANHPRAQYMLGILLAHGWGAPSDDARAVKWFTRSAENGYAPACYHLGWMYHKGDGVVQDDERSLRLMEQAADEGMAAAHLALGRFHEHGEGVRTDSVQALKWYSLAMHFAQSQPLQFDNAAFAERAQAALDALAARMDPFSQEQGRRLARQWLANLPQNRTGPPRLSLGIFRSLGPGGTGRSLRTFLAGTPVAKLLAGTGRAPLPISTRDNI
ncbi:MAG: tetratricopeptide repeat protein [Thiobacillaceae bacterium]